MSSAVMATSYQLTGPTQRRLPATAEAANLNPTPSPTIRSRISDRSTVLIRSWVSCLGRSGRTPAGPVWGEMPQ
jgi:hypothetical protein